MKGTVFIFSLLMLQVLVLSFAQEAKLSYRLDPGTTYQLDIDMQQNTSSESVNSEEISMSSKLILEFRLDSVNIRGLIFMSVCYKDLHLSMLAPGMGIDINSESGKNEFLGALADSLEHQWFRISMNESGKLQSLEGLSEIFQAMQDYPSRDPEQSGVTLGTLGEAYGPDAFKSLFHLFVDFYPTVQPIKNWTNDLTYYFNTKPVEIANRYYFTKSTNEVITIQGMGMIKSLKSYKEVLPLGEVSSSVSGTQTYDFQTDADSGWLIRCISRQRLLIETIIVKSNQLPSGLKIPSYTETTFEVKGSIL